MDGGEHHARLGDRVRAPIDGPAYGGLPWTRRRSGGADYTCRPSLDTHACTTTQMPNLGKSPPPMSLLASLAAVRVLVVDDSLPFREATRELIQGTAGFEWIGDANCGEVGVEQAARLEPDLVLMDVRMPGIGGIEAAKRIGRHTAPSIVVLVTGAEPPTDLPNGTAAEILPKHRLSPASLRRLWQDHATSGTDLAE
jgi:CheY-like chemotaxis protein